MLHLAASPLVLAFSGTTSVTWRSLSAADKRTYTFEHFKAEFPGSVHDETTFESNLAKIHAHNAKHARSWTAGVNSFTAMTTAQFKDHYRYSASTSATLAAEPADVSSHVPVSSLPASVDWRTVKPSVVTPAKNQEACGSCWAFSTAETLESHIAIKTGTLYTFAPQQFVSCAPNPRQCGGTGGCEGSTQWLGFNYTIGAGITQEKDYPYEGSDSKCDTSKVKPVATIKGYERLPKNNYTALMNAVATLGPIAISAAAEPWQLYESGVFDEDCGADVDHAIQLVGYGGSASPGPSPSPPGPGPSPTPGDCIEQTTKAACVADHCHWCSYLGDDFCMSEPCAAPAAEPAFALRGAATDYWLVRNSWGASWGEQGYIRIARYGNTSKGEPCMTDNTPGDGTACKGGPTSIQVCGLCGIMSDSSYPTGGALV